MTESAREVQRSAEGPVDPRQATRNALANAGRYGVSGLLALVVTPYMLDVLGTERFGLWAIGGALLGILRSLDLGVRAGVARTVARQRGDPSAAANTVGTAVAVSILIGGVATVGMWSGVDGLRRLLDVPPDLAREAAVVFVGIAAVATLELALAPYAAALEGLGRTDTASGVDIVQRVLSAIGTVLVLAVGWGLAGLVAKNGVTAVVAGFGYWRRLKVAARSLAVGVRVDRSAARDLLRFGRHVQAVNLSAMLVEPANKLILTRLGGLDAVALYEIGLLVVGQITGGLSALATVVFPEVAAVAGAGRERLVALWQAAERPVALAAGSLGILIALGPSLAVAWLGPEYAEAGRVMAVLAAGWLVALACIPAFLVAQGAGAEARSTVAGTVTVVGSVGGAVVLAPGLGAVGVAVGRALGLAVGGGVAWFLTALRWPRTLPLSLAGRVVVAAVVGASAAQLAAAQLPENLLAVIFAGALGTLVYGLALMASGLISTGDVRTAAAALSGSR